MKKKKFVSHKINAFIVSLDKIKYIYSKCNK